MLREEPYLALQAFLAKVDEQQFNAWANENDQPLDATHRAWLESIVGPFASLTNPWDQWWPEYLGDRYKPAFVRQAMSAHANGELTLLQRRNKTGIMAIPEGLKTDRDIARPRTYITGIDPLNVDDVSWAEVTSRLMLAEFHHFLKAYIPGFEHCVIERVADSIGLRGGRCLDVPACPQSRFQGAAKASDAIFTMKKGNDQPVEIPFAALVPEGVEGRDMMLVALTGWGQDTHKQQSKAAGFDHHLVKPADVATIQQLLSTIPPAPGHNGVASSIANGR